MSRYGKDLEKVFIPLEVAEYSADTETTTEERGDIEMTAAEFQKIFGFTPKDNEAYHLTLGIEDLKDEC